MAEARIAVFDSGVGGLSILREVRALLPAADLTYVADHAYAPYGSRELHQVRRRAVAVSRYLRARAARVVVVACNTASAAALHHLRDLYPGTPFVGMEPAVKPAAELSDRGVIGVLATPATFQGELYASVVDRHASRVQVVEEAAEGLALAIDEGRDDEAALIVRHHVDRMLAAGVDRIVLGCTHYPFVADVIAERVGPGVELVDPSAAVARQVQRLAGSAADGDASTIYLTTGPADRFALRAGALLGTEVDAATVEIG